MKGLVGARTQDKEAWRSLLIASGKPPLWSQDAKTLSTLWKIEKIEEKKLLLQSKENGVDQEKYWRVLNMSCENKNTYLVVQTNVVRM